MEFSDVADLVNQLNSNSDQINVGYYFSFDGNYFYCFLVKGVNYNSPYTQNPTAPYFYQTDYFQDTGFSNNPAFGTMPLSQITLNYTVSEDYDMRILKKIKLKKNNDGKIVDLISTVRELLSYCKNLKGVGGCPGPGQTYKEDFFDNILEKFAKKMTNQDLLDCL